MTRLSPTIRQALNDLQILYKEHESSFEAFLTRNGNNSIHVNNLQQLMIEIFKSMNPTLLWEFHERKHVTYNLRIQSLCKLPSGKTMNFGLDSISFRGILLWNTLDDGIKREKTLACFQKRKGKWSGARCTCKIRQ